MRANEHHTHLHNTFPQVTGYFHCKTWFSLNPQFSLHPDNSKFTSSTIRCCSTPAMLRLPDFPFAQQKNYSMCEIKIPYALPLLRWSPWTNTVKTKYTHTELYILKYSLSSSFFFVAGCKSGFPELSTTLAANHYFPHTHNVFYAHRVWPCRYEGYVCNGNKLVFGTGILAE